MTQRDAKLQHQRQGEADQAAEERDPPYLAQLLKDHPDLTREKALEMIKAFGG
ncbi:hypothetical protein [Bradyrhizobium cenepequi]|uniref:hypothetical protein n=1 Tax=Bradyrhizobium cenepequi TaxID=2821403 RepID=UPI001CE300B8|nr:hypothetical protein [Bradyrhizobium cenepequi]MCA6109587.1 hypothetical protein [Bradyrhizobium cenepequi]